MHVQRRHKGAFNPYPLFKTKKKFQQDASLQDNAALQNSTSAALQNNLSLQDNFHSTSILPDFGTDNLNRPDQIEISIQLQNLIEQVSRFSRLELTILLQTISNRLDGCQ